MSRDERMARSYAHGRHVVLILLVLSLIAVAQATFARGASSGPASARQVGSLAAPRACGDPITLFTDDMESGPNGWTTSHSSPNGGTCNTDEWQQNTTDSHSPITSWSNEPYQAGVSGTCLNYLTMPEIATPGNIGNLHLTFWHHYYSEDGFDYGTVELSTDGGSSWTTVSPQYTGGSATMAYTQETLALQPYISAGDNLALRFRFLSDDLLAAPPYLGWFIDDVTVAGEESCATATPTTTPTVTPTPTATPSVTVASLVFGPASVVDAQRTEGEPLNFFDLNGNYWESGPWGTSTQQSFIHRSTDGGDQFNVVSPVDLRPDPGPGGGDTDVVTDDQGNAYFVDLEALLNLGVAVSNDNGNNWRKNPAAVGSSAVDRQWFAVDNGPTAGADDNTIFLTYREAALGSYIYSTPGSTGVTDPVGGLIYQNASSNTTNAVNSGAPCGQMRFDPLNRNLYLACVSGNHLQITKGHVNAGQRTGISFSTVQSPASPGGAPGNIFPAVAVDRAGNLYAVWIDENNFNVYYAASTDQGQTWGAVHQLNSGDAATNVFAWAVAGTNGNLVVAWLGNNAGINSDNMPNWFDDRQAATAYKWYGYVALVNQATGSTPAIIQARFTEKPMHYGQICNGGLSCTVSSGDRTMADYFAVNLDLDGRMRFVYNDTTSQHHGAHLYEIRQLAGPTALGTMLDDTQPHNAMPDPSGDAQSPHYSPAGPGANLPQLDFTSLRLSVPATDTLRVIMSLSDLSSLLPPAGKSNAFWITRFQARSLGDGGEEAYRILYAGAESVAGAQPTFFAGSGTSSQAGVPGNGCTTTTPDNCKIVQYPAEEAATGSLMCQRKLVIDVPLQGGFGPNRPISDTLLYNVTAFSGGRSNATTDLYADVDSTKSFDFNLANACTWADVNCSCGTVDVNDIQLVAEAWNGYYGSGVYSPQYDINNGGLGDCANDIIDVQLVAGQFGQPSCSLP